MRVLEQLALPRRRVTLLATSKYAATLGFGILFGFFMSERITLSGLLIAYLISFWSIFAARFLLKRDANRAMDEIIKYDFVVQERLKRFRRELDGEVSYLQ